MTATMHWTGNITARSSIAHGGETRGTLTLLRREIVVQPDGRLMHVPVISGNALRGRLRRIGEELLRDTLAYEGHLALATAHALRGGGSLAKITGEPLSGRRLHTLRTLVPHVGIFGCAGGGRIIDGCLQVGKVVPHLTETAHILGTDPQTMPAFNATQVETYVRSDDADQHAFIDLAQVTQVQVDDQGIPTVTDDPPAAPGAGASQLMLYRVETFPAGTTFTTWLRLSRATDLEVAFFTDVLDTFIRHGRLGGRAGIGHGEVDVDLTRAVLTGADPAPIDWRQHLYDHRADALTALQALT